MQIASKTFILGEYLALSGGPCLLMTAPPYFKCEISFNTDSTSTPNFHPNSPAGKFYQDHRHKFNDAQINFMDPHQGAGGFGASGAQFLTLYLAIYPDSDWQTVLSDYQRYDQPTPGSGADVVAQYCHYHQDKPYCWFDRNANELTPLDWPFADLQVRLIRTHQKLATHMHLNTLKTLKIDPLATILTQAKNAIATNDSQAFCDSIHAYHQALRHQNLVCESTLKQLETYRKNPTTRAAKGCGALGAEVIVVIA